MQITETSAEGLKHEFKVVVSAEDIERRMVTRLDELGRTTRLPGFRPGKVPMAILRQRFGDSVMGEVIERSVNESSVEVIQEKGLRPALAPSIVLFWSS